MKKMNDEELQKWLEENGHKSDDLPEVDAKAYHLLFNLLSKYPDQGLPYDFSARVTRRVQARTRQNSELRSYLISIAVVSVVIAFIYSLFLLLKPQLGSGFLNIAAEYKWVFVLGIFSFLTIQYLDQVLIKSTIFKR
ncbi:MAG: hypothetical protein ACHQIM_00650 [Sphingobacteriales bacterium]